jgi:hypothetical protein
MVGVEETPAKFDPNMLNVNNPEVGQLRGDIFEIEGAR